MITSQQIPGNSPTTCELDELHGDIRNQALYEVLCAT
jgi:hypothetical protein